MDYRIGDRICVLLDGGDGVNVPGTFVDVTEFEVIGRKHGRLTLRQVIHPAWDPQRLIAEQAARPESDEPILGVFRTETGERVEEVDGGGYARSSGDREEWLRCGTRRWEAGWEDGRRCTLPDGHASTCAFPLRADDETPMTPEQIAEVRAQRR